MHSAVLGIAHRPLGHKFSRTADAGRRHFKEQIASAVNGLIKGLVKNVFR